MDAFAVFQAARAAQKEWSLLPLRKRCDRLLTLRETLINHTQSLISLLPTAHSSSFPALTGEILASVEQMTHAVKFAPETLLPKVLKSRGFLQLLQKTVIYRHPLGVIILCGSDQYSLLATVNRLCLALLAGNSIILFSPGRSSQIDQKIVDLCQEACLPLGLVQVVQDLSLKDLLTQRPHKVFFRGTSAGAKELIAEAAEHPIPIHLGRDTSHALIALADADLDFTSSALLSSLSEHLPNQEIEERFYLHENVAEALLQQIRTKIDIGAIALRESPLIRQLLSGDRVFRYKSITDLIDRINSRQGQMRISIFSRNHHLAKDVARQLSSSFVVINDHPYAPEFTEISLLEFVRVQKIRSPKTRLFHFKAPWWLPHSTFQFETFKTLLDLYRRHFSDRLRAVPILLWNMIQMFKNERRL